jgi:hypothetical protein
MDNPALEKIWSTMRPICLLSKRLVVSKANEDTVVSEPQNLTAINSAFFDRGSIAVIELQKDQE